MKYTYNVDTKDGNTLTVSYTSEYANFPVIQKVIFLNEEQSETLAIHNAAPIQEWALAHPEVFPQKPPGTLSELVVDTTKKPE
jgi:hypothetical protein